MKKIIALTLCLFVAYTSFAQLEWEAKSSMPNTGRYAYSSFTIDGKIYCGLGTSSGSTPYFNDFWEYDPAADVWTQKANFPGSGLYGSTSFVVDGIGYVCLGLSSSSTVTSTGYSYNPSTNAWTQISSFTGSSRYGAESFVIGDTAFIACGSAGGPTVYKKDLWMYVPSTDTWTQKADFPGGIRNSLTAFSLGQYGYVGAGNSGSSTTHNTFWKYDKASNTWTSIANMPQNKFVATDFILDGKAYVGLGKLATGNTSFDDFHSYDPTSNSWSSSISNSANITLRSGVQAVNVKGDIYIMLGTYENLRFTGLYKLKENDTCDYTDTTYITVQDTLMFNINTNSVSQPNLVGMKVYPNPAGSQITIDIADNTQMSNYTLKIYNTLGAEVYSQTVSANSYVVNTSTLGGAGTYFLEVYDSINNKRGRKALIIQ